MLGVHTHNLQVRVLPDTGRSTLLETTLMCSLIVHLMSTQMHVTGSAVHLDSQSCKCVHPAGPIVILTFSRLFVCLSVQDLGKPGNVSMADNWHVVRVSELAGWFISSLQKEVRRCQCDRQSTVEAQLSLHKRSIAKEPRNTGMPRNRQPVTTNQQRSGISLVFSTLCPMHRSSTTCMVMQTYLVPACSSPAGFWTFRRQAGSPSKLIQPATPTLAYASASHAHTAMCTSQPRPHGHVHQPATPTRPCVRCDLAHIIQSWYAPITKSSQDQRRAGQLERLHYS